MSRKKWTHQTKVDDTLLQFREKRKWQIALRRYILEKHKCLSYAPYFGLDNNKFRQWIECQFDESLSWDNFSSAWQFDHILPVAYFDFLEEEDLRLCWNFINIRVAKTVNVGIPINRIDVLAAKHYFELLYQQTDYTVCAAMLRKIRRLEEEQVRNETELQNFIIQHKDYLNAVQSFTSDDFERLNTGTELNVLLSEKEFLKKYGS